MSYSRSWHDDGGQSRPVDIPHRTERSSGEQDFARTTRLLRQGIAVHAEFRHRRDSAGLDRAISCFRMAVASVRDNRTVATGGPGDPYLAKCLNSLGVALMDRYRLSRDTRDLDAALRHLLAAHEKSESGTTGHARILHNLLSALDTRLSVADPPLPKRLRERLPSRESLRSQMTGEPGISVVERFEASCESGYATAAAQGTAAGYPYLARAVSLLPRVVWGAREHILGDLAERRGLATDAAACALAAGRPEHAVELLDHGRAVLWERHLKTRTRYEEMAHAASPQTRQLQRRMQRVHAGLSELEPLARAAGNSSQSAAGDPRMDFDRSGRPWLREGLGARMDDWSLRRLETEWARLSHTAQRELPDYAFVMAEYADLRPAAEEGCVVYVNVSPFRCDALIVDMRHREPVHIPLPELTATEAEERAQRYLAVMRSAAADREEVIRDMLDWLWRSVAAPVLKALPITEAPARTWWVPTGPLTTLPLHAAAPRTAADGPCVLNLVISSYTSTLGALVRARRVRDGKSGPRPQRKHLLVTPDTAHLPGAARLHARLRELMPHWRRTVLAGADATRDRVRSALPEHAWAHFDCHGVQDLDEPLKSHLALGDEPLTVSDLADLCCARAEFAMLAACTTAAGGDLVRDEWISLAAALMYAEYQSVIGTLWPVADAPTARIAQSVYEHLLPVPKPLGRLFARPALRYAAGADALRLAVREERSRRPRHPSAWVSFVHYGV
ncbi:CHAT domain-containing protein [Streptomyces sp. NPDC018019]|uniref:CHAT domain-containing protein n=1 Tax=Streptomyces sp. NPDC018019 TaxID=3365030 RepID=UPI0037B7CF3A